jgi:ArsR family transcriptional regulator, arsenate/arsenite/antimonite-responsive transcriptional repressor
MYRGAMIGGAHHDLRDSRDPRDPREPGARGGRGSRALLAARRFHALGDELRLEVLALLKAGERCVCELTGRLGMAQSRLSFHLKVLKDAGLISQRRCGRWSYYALEPEAFRDLEAFLEEVPPAATAPCCRAAPQAAPQAPSATQRREIR